MTKVKINKTFFEMSEDASMVFDAYMDKLKIYLEKNKISKQEFNEIEKNLENETLQLLDKQSNIEKSDIENIIEKSNIKKKIKPEKEKKWIFYAFTQIIANFIKIILSLFIVLFQLIILWIKILFLLITFWIILILIFAIPFVFFPWIIDGQVILSFVPNIVKYSLIITEISFTLFFTYFLLSIIKTKFSKNGILAWAIITLVIWINWAVYGWLNMLYNYWHTFNKVEKYTFEIKDIKELKVEWLKKLNLDFPIFWDRNYSDIDTTSCEIIDNTWSNLEIEIKTIINDKDKSESDKYFEKINNLDFALEWDKLILKTEKDKIFKEIVPFKFLRREIIIRKPENVNVNDIDINSFEKQSNDEKNYEETWNLKNE